MASANIIESVVRAAKYHLPLTLAIIGGNPLAFTRYVDLYRSAMTQFGGTEILIGAHSPGYIAETDEQAREEAWPHYAVMMNRIGQERGWRPMTRRDFDQAAGPEGALFVGSVQTVASKIVKVARALSLSRFDLKYSMGTLPHERLMSCIKLYGSSVAPLVQEQLATA